MNASNYIELDEQQRGLTRSQTLNSLGVVILALGMLFLGLLMRNSALNARAAFVDQQSGIRVQIPANWLISSNQAEFVVQAEDPGARPFKTLLRVSLIPVGAEATPRNVIDTLTLQRAGRLSTYRILSITPSTIGDSPAIEMDYAYVQADTNPFISVIPIVVRGRDVVVIEDGQAIIVTYREAETRFAENVIYFEAFLASLEF
jgi:hypothetical protein